MTLSVVPFALQNAPINADTVRQAISSLVPNGGGLVQTGDLAVSQLATPAMGVQVGVGRAWIEGTSVAHLANQKYGAQAMYFVFNDAPYPLTVNTSDATNPRIDVVYAAVQDSRYSGASDQGVLAIAHGQPANGASYPANAPTLPDNAIALAWIMVGAGATTITAGNITNLAAGAQKPFAHMGKSNGFQQLTLSASKVVMTTAPTLIGGFVFDSANSALIVPLTGWYRIHIKYYYTGVSGSLNQGGLWVNGSSAGQYGGINCNVNKVDGNDVYVHGTSRVKLNAGDSLSVWGYASCYTWGGNGYDGCYLEAEYDGPY